MQCHLVGCAEGLPARCLRDLDVVPLGRSQPGPATRLDAGVPARRMDHAGVLTDYLSHESLRNGELLNAFYALNY